MAVTVRRQSKSARVSNVQPQPRWRPGRQTGDKDMLAMAAEKAWQLTSPSGASSLSISRTSDEDESSFSVTSASYSASVPSAGGVLAATPTSGLYTPTSASAASAQNSLGPRRVPRERNLLSPLDESSSKPLVATEHLLRASITLLGCYTAK